MNPIFIWFGLMVKAVFKGLFPALVLLGGYYAVCWYFKWRVSGKIVYIIVAYAFLFGLFGAIGSIWDSAVITPR